MSFLRSFSRGVLVATATLSLGAGVASAAPVTAPTPEEPMPITVHPKPVKNAQPPIEWTVWAAPHAIVPQGKSLMYYSPLPQLSTKMASQGTFGEPYRYSTFYDIQTVCNDAIRGRTQVESMSPAFYFNLIKHKGEVVRSPMCYQIANGKWVYEYTQYGDPDKGKTVRR